MKSHNGGVYCDDRNKYFISLQQWSATIDGQAITQGYEVRLHGKQTPKQTTPFQWKLSFEWVFILDPD